MCIPGSANPAATTLSLTARAGVAVAAALTDDVAFAVVGVVNGLVAVVIVVVVVGVNNSHRIKTSPPPFTLAAIPDRD